MYENDLVSVIVPVYCVEKFIELSIESICKQTYKNIEIILVDDETKDDSIELAKHVLNNYPDVRYRVIKEKNKGLPGARNEGVKHSCGSYFCFIDSDDCIDSKHIEHMMKLIHEFDLQICYSDFEETSESNRLGNSKDDSTSEIVVQDRLLNDFLLRKRKIHCCSLIMSKSLIDKFAFNEKLKFGEDVEFMWRVFSHVDKIGHCFQTSYKYLIRKNSLMTSYSYEKDEIFVKEFSKTINMLVNEFPSREILYKQALYRNLLGWMHQLSRKTSYNQFKKGILLVDLKEMEKVLSTLDDLNVRILTKILKLNTLVLYLVMRYI